MDDTDNIYKRVGDAERRARVDADSYDHRTADEIITEMDGTARVEATRTLNDHIVKVMGKVLAPVVGDLVEQLKADNARLEARVVELETKLDVARRLDTIEQRLEALPSATIKRIA